MQLLTKQALKDAGTEDVILPESDLYRPSNDQGSPMPPEKDDDEQPDEQNDM